MFKSDLSRIEGRVKAICRRMRCHHDHRALTIASIKSLIEVSLLRLGRDTCRRTSALNINYHKRKFSHYRQTESL